MRTLRALVPVFLLLSFNWLASGQAQPSPDPVQGVTDPAPPPQLQPTPVDVVLDGDAAPVPAWATYRVFFMHLAQMETVADQQDAAGRQDNAAKLRAYEQNAAGLSDAEGAILKQAAHDCNQAVSNQDASGQTAIKAFRDQHPEGPDPTAPPAELVQLRDQRIQIINSYIDQLHAALGDESFQKLDGYVQANFQPQVIDVPPPPEPPGRKPPASMASGNPGGGR